MRGGCAPSSAPAPGWRSSAPASSARRSPRPRARLGAEVTVIEALDLPARRRPRRRGRAAGSRDLHRDEGVRMLTRGAARGAPRRRPRRGARARRAAPRSTCDVVVVGGRHRPGDTGWLRGSGLEPGGVRTDAAGPHQLPDVFAAGDARAPFDPRLGDHVAHRALGRRRRQGAAAATAMLGDYPPRRRCRASGATSTGCASSTSATPTRADGLRVERRPRRARLRRRLHPRRPPGRGARGRPPARARRPAAADRAQRTGPTTEPRGGSMSYIPTIDRTSLQRPRRLRRRSPRGLRRSTTSRS